MHGGPMPARVHRVNAAKGRVVEWTGGWRSGWSESRELRQGGRARTTASNGLANDLRLESPPALSASLSREGKAAVAVLFSVTNILLPD